MAKCESMFFFEELSRHPDEKQEFQKTKRETEALETAAAKIELDLKGSEVTSSRGNLSLNKHVEEILFGKFPYEYVQYFFYSFIDYDFQNCKTQNVPARCCASIVCGVKPNRVTREKRKS